MKKILLAGLMTTGALVLGLANTASAAIFTIDTLFSLTESFTSGEQQSVPKPVAVLLIGIGLIAMIEARKKEKA